MAELGAVALEFALREELFVDDHGERGAVDLLLVGEVFELGKEGTLPGVVERMGEDEHGGVGGVEADEGNGGPAVGVDDGLEVGGEGLVDCGEVGGAVEVVWIWVLGLAVREAAGVLVLGGEGEEMVAQGGVGARAVSGDELGAAAVGVLLPGALGVGSLGGERDGGEGEGDGKQDGAHGLSLRRDGVWWAAAGKADTLKGMSDSGSPTYFVLFSLPRHLHVDLAALEKTFYAGSRRLHPDRFAAKPPAEQERALKASSELNDAYRTLKDPIARTQYLLTLEGVEMEEQSRAATDAARASGGAKKQVVPPELLEEVFELNMQLAEMRAAKEFGEDEPELRRDLERAQEEFAGKMGETQREMEGLWTRWDAAEDAGDGAGREAAKVGMVGLLNRRSYLRNLLRDVGEALGA